jgi:hypothetical protein
MLLRDTPSWRATAASVRGVVAYRCVAHRGARREYDAAQAGAGDLGPADLELVGRSFAECADDRFRIAGPVSRPRGLTRIQHLLDLKWGQAPFR